MRLYDLSEQYNDLQDLLDQDADNETLRSMLDGIEQAFDQKVESIIKLMKSKEAEKEAIKAERDRLAERASKLDREIEWLKTYVQDQMTVTGKTRVKSALFNITLVKNPPSLKVLDETKIPQEFFRVKESVSLDKRGLIELLKNGEQIQGVELEQKQSVRVS